MTRTRKYAHYTLETLPVLAGGNGDDDTLFSEPVGSRTVEGVKGDDTKFFQSSQSTSGSSSGSLATSASFQALVPPIIELMIQSMAKRDTERGQAKDLINAISGIAKTQVPGSATAPLGFEKGGIYDILGGIVSGHGTEKFGAGVSDAIRNPGTVTIPISALAKITEPSVQDEAKTLEPTAERILDLIRSFQTAESESTSTATSGSQSTSTSQLQEPGAEAGLTDADILASLFTSGLGEQAGAGIMAGPTVGTSAVLSGTGDVVEYKFDPITGINRWFYSGTDTPSPAPALTPGSDTTPSTVTPTGSSSPQESTEEGYRKILDFLGF